MYEKMCEYVYSTFKEVLENGNVIVLNENLEMIGQVRYRENLPSVYLDGFEIKRGLTIVNPKTTKDYVLINGEINEVEFENGKSEVMVIPYAKIISDEELEDVLFSMAYAEEELHQDFFNNKAFQDLIERYSSLKLKASQKIKESKELEEEMHEYEAGLAASIHQHYEYYEPSNVGLSDYEIDKLAEIERDKGKTDI